VLPFGPPSICSFFSFFIFINIFQNEKMLDSAVSTPAAECGTPGGSGGVRAEQDATVAVVAGGSGAQRTQPWHAAGARHLQPWHAARLTLAKEHSGGHSCGRGASAHRLSMAEHGLHPWRREASLPKWRSTKEVRHAAGSHSCGRERAAGRRADGGGGPGGRGGAPVRRRHVGGGGR
jgi:hypothetical protein